jgi:hypothetical protein
VCEILRTMKTGIFTAVFVSTLPIASLVSQPDEQRAAAMRKPNAEPGHQAPHAETELSRSATTNAILEVLSFRRIVIPDGAFIDRCALETLADVGSIMAGLPADQNSQLVPKAQTQCDHGNRKPLPAPRWFLLSVRKISIGRVKLIAGVDGRFANSHVEVYTLEQRGRDNQLQVLSVTIEKSSVGFK